MGNSSCCSTTNEDEKNVIEKIETNKESDLYGFLMNDLQIHASNWSNNIANMEDSVDYENVASFIMNNNHNDVSFFIFKNCIVFL